ncbi:hypothetical protein GCM10012287_55190 [Streptomyces daqingensis]|uniref:Uncharacterized protein n=1 Tax=Streptomyces daqingensis TaxID=1472640 RepID=A0ABQ2MTV9_9ACTN|nr:hypothetical protein GCM10012287_55190 [Streptomyces daqingensis]
MKSGPPDGGTVARDPVTAERRWQRPGRGAGEVRPFGPSGHGEPDRGTDDHYRGDDAEDEARP